MREHALSAGANARECTQACRMRFKRGICFEIGNEPSGAQNAPEGTKECKIRLVL